MPMHPPMPMHLPMTVRPPHRRPAPRRFALALTASLLACLSAGPLAVAQESRGPGAAAAPAPVKKDVPYVPTPQELVDRMLEMAKVTDKDVVYDLGCGDGRMVVTAAKKY